MSTKPPTRVIRWRQCGCREIEDDDAITWTTLPGNEACGDPVEYGGHPHGSVIREITQEAKPVITTIWQFDDPPA